MKKLRLFATILFALAGKLIFAQSPDKIKAYIEIYKDIAIEEMQRTGVPAAITLAQGIHETGAGTSDLVIQSNNHFGIKCKTEWTGAAVYHDDDAKGECFRKYDDPLDSYRDHSDFLKLRPYYSSLFQLDPTDYKGWANGLKKAGYATNPKYAQILIKLIEDYNLEEYSLIALNKAPNNPGVVYASNAVKTESVDNAKSAPEVQNAVFVQKMYPSGTFKINETSVIVVTKGSSFLGVAEKYNISLSRLFEFNDMKPVDIAEKDQLMYLQRKRKLGANEFHVVVAGETLYDIAQYEGIRLENLLEYNQLKQNMRPMTGEKLNLQWKASSMPKLAEIAPGQVAFDNKRNQALVNVIADNDFMVHIVQPKETVYAISKKYDVAVSDVIKWNEMNTMDLKAGQQIRINKKSANAN